MAGMTTAQFARLARVSKGYAHKLLRSLGFKPIARERGRGAGKYYWSRTQLLAVMVVPQLEKIGVVPAYAVRFAQGLGSMGDEQFELVVAQRRTIALVVGGAIHPKLLCCGHVRRCIEQRTEEYREMGLEITPVDLGPLYEDITAAVAAARKGEANVADDAD